MDRQDNFDCASHQSECQVPVDSPEPDCGICLSVAYLFCFCKLLRSRSIHLMQSVSLMCESMWERSRLSHSAWKITIGAVERNLALAGGVP